MGLPVARRYTRAVNGLGYDLVVSPGELAFLGRWRRELLADLAGHEVLEIGAGTGRNLDHYPPDASVTLSEPNPGMRERLVGRTGREGGAARRVIADTAESSSFEDASFDDVVCTLVLCSVQNLDRAAAEIGRVLRPGGRLRLIEHVGASRPVGRFVQRALEPLWRPLAGGCHLTRDPLAALARVGFTVERLSIERPLVAPPFVVPMIRGVLRR